MLQLPRGYITLDPYASSGFDTGIVSTYARGINNNGQVLGEFVVNPVTQGFFIYNPDGKYTHLECPSILVGKDVHVWGINKYLSNSSPDIKVIFSIA